MRPGARQRLEIRQTVERQIYISRRAAKLVTLNVCDEILRQVFGANHLDKGQPRIDTRRNDVCVNLVSVRERDAFSLAVLQNNPGYWRFRANLGAGFASGVRDCIRNRAGAATRNSPRAKRAVNLAHIMMQQNVSRTRRAHAEKGPDDS